MGRKRSKGMREDGALIDDDELLVRLEATRASFPSPKLNVSFAVSGFTLKEKRSIDVIDVNGDSHSIALAADPSGWMRPNVAVSCQFLIKIYLKKDSVLHMRAI
jgi:hypothetical protein